MNKIHPLSPITTIPDFDIFAVPATQLSIERTIVTEHRPLSILNSVSNIEFMIDSPIDEYVLLREMMLQMRIRVDIKKATGTGTIGAGDWAKIGGVNNLLHSLFKAVDFEINGKSITLNPQTYAYKAYFETNLGYPSDAQNTHLSASGYFIDDSHKETRSAKQTNFMKPSTIVNTGTGKTIDLLGKLFIDICQQPKALLGGTKIKITLIPNDPNFYLWADDNTLTPTVTFEYASLFVSRAKVNHSVVEAHHTALRHTPAKYPITRGNVKLFTVNANSLDVNIDNAIVGQIPRRMFVAFVKNKASNGDLTTNPYNFEHFNLNYLVASVDGIQYPSIPFTPDFSKGIFAREFLSIFDTLNGLSTENTVYLDIEDYKSGNTIYGFTFGADKIDDCYKSGYVNPRYNGSLGLHIKFATAPTEAITVITYSEFDNVLEIDQNNEVITDYI